MKAVFSTVALALMPLLLQAQYKAETWDQSFRDSGKIYVVVAVIGLILLVMLGYLVVQDRKLAKLEKQLKDK